MYPAGFLFQYKENFNAEESKCFEAMNVSALRSVATCTTDEVIATQRRCYEIPLLVYKK
jgi:hypothetical protein